MTEFIFHLAEQYISHPDTLQIYGETRCSDFITNGTDILETDPWKWISYTKVNAKSIPFIQRNRRKNTLLIRAPWPPLCPWVPNSVKVYGSDWMETSLEIDKRKWVSGYRDRTTSSHMTRVARAKKRRKEERKISFLKSRSMNSLSWEHEQKNCAEHRFRRCWSVCLSCKQPHLQANCPLSHSLWSHYFLILLHSIVRCEFQQLDVILMLSLHQLSVKGLF